MADITATLTGQVTITGELTVPMGIVPRGEIEVTENGEYDVTNYETAQVAVPQPSGSVTITANGQHDVTDYVTADVQVPQPSGSIEITENGTVDVADFAQAVVNVQTTSKNVQVYDKRTLVISDTTYTAQSFFQITVAKTGVYTVRWSQARGANNASNRGIMRINGEQYGLEQYGYNLWQYAMAVSITGVSLNEGDVVDVALKSYHKNYSTYAWNLIIEEE